MTISSENELAARLPLAEDWLRSLTPQERQLLTDHRDGSSLPSDVVALLKRGPISPMEAPDIDGGVRMPPSIRQTLETMQREAESAAPHTSA
jgi:hypothetical protein